MPFLLTIFIKGKCLEKSNLGCILRFSSGTQSGQSLGTACCSGKERRKRARRQGDAASAERLLCCERSLLSTLQTLTTRDVTLCAYQIRLENSPTSRIPANLLNQPPGAEPGNSARRPGDAGIWEALHSMVYPSQQPVLQMRPLKCRVTYRSHTARK